MLLLAYVGAAGAQSDPANTGLFDFAPWWVRLIVGIVLIAIAGVVHYFTRRARGDSKEDGAHWLTWIFGALGALAIYGSLFGRN